MSNELLARLRARGIPADCAERTPEQRKLGTELMMQFCDEQHERRERVRHAKGQERPELEVIGTDGVAKTFTRRRLDREMAADGYRPQRVPGPARPEVRVALAFHGDGPAGTLLDQRAAVTTLPTAVMMMMMVPQANLSDIFI